MIIELIQERILEPEKKSSMEVPSYLKEDDPVVDPPKLSGAEPEEEEEY